MVESENEGHVHPVEVAAIKFKEELLGLKLSAKALVAELMRLPNGGESVFKDLTEYEWSWHPQIDTDEVRTMIIDQRSRLNLGLNSLEIGLNNQIEFYSARPKIMIPYIHFAGHTGYSSQLPPEYEFANRHSILSASFFLVSEGQVMSLKRLVSFAPVSK